MSSAPHAQSTPSPARGLSRRTLLTLLAAGVLGGCTGDEAAPGRSATGSAAARAGAARGDGTLVWSNWPSYIDKQRAAPKHPTLAAFSERTGVQVEYREVIEDNVEFVDSIAKGLRARRDVDTDLMVLTSWMSARLIRSRQVARLDRSRIPHRSRLIGALASPSYDPERRYSMPWQAGLTGIAYDATKVGRAIGSVSELLSRKDLAGRVGLLTEFNDTVGLVALAGGADLTELTGDDAQQSLDRIREVQQSGHVRGFYGNEFVGALTSGRIAACLAWSGDVLQVQLENPTIKFVVPEEGLMIWSDDFLVPQGSSQGAAAAELIDWYYRPEVAAQVAAWVNYICPVAGAQEEMQKIDPDLALSPLIFPDPATLDRSFQFPTLDDEASLRKTFSDLVDAS